MVIAFDGTFLDWAAIIMRGNTIDRTSTEFRLVVQELRTARWSHCGKHSCLMCYLSLSFA